MDFKVGDQVEAIDDIVQGVVVKISGGQITVESVEGFLLKYTATELLKVTGSNAIKVSNFEVARIKAEKEVPKKRSNKKLRPKERNAPLMEVDLHIEKIQKVVLIHGVGEGILKEELYFLLKRYENAKYYDADYQKYGMGATEVYFFQTTL